MRYPSAYRSFPNIQTTLIKISEGDSIPFWPISFCKSFSPYLLSLIGKGFHSFLAISFCKSISPYLLSLIANVMGDSQRSLPPPAFNTWDLKVHRTPKNVLGKIDESGPFSQALPGAFHDEPPFSGSFNVSMEAKGKNVDVSLNVSGTPRCDEASSSGYSDLPKRSEGQDVDVNLNISGAPQCDEAPSSSSSSGPTKSRSDLISSKRKYKVQDVNLNDIQKHIHELWKSRKKGNHKKARSLGHFPWPDVPGLQKLKQIVLLGTDLPREDIYGAVKAILEEIGRVSVANAALLVLAHTLERSDASITDREKFWYFIEEMDSLAGTLGIMKHGPKGMLGVMQEATSLIIEGALLCSTQSGRSSTSRLLSMPVFDRDLSKIRQKLKDKYTHVRNEFHYCISPFSSQWRSRRPKEYPTHAVEEDLLWTLPQKVDIKTGEVEEDLLAPELQKAYIHNNEQVEEDLVFIWRQKAYIHNGQVEEDLLVPELQVEEDLVFTKRKKAYIHDGQVEEDLLSTGCQKVFKIEALVDATNHFHDDNKVGEGGAGAVYKGTTHDGKQIAVKKMSITDRQSREAMEKQFENEKLLVEVQHRNLVNLLGYCEHGLERFLVYEYLPNGSLDKFLSDPEKRKLLDWQKRYNIIQGIAQGLLYLHKDSQVLMVHRDIKASNILLDEKLNSKISDFGTAKLCAEDRTHVTATTPVGTYGYRAPEYGMYGRITVKADVYSFGVVLFELLTGKLILNNGTEYLEWVWRSYTQNKVADTIDRTITETWDKEKKKVLRCFRVALLCIQEDETLRPTMSEVITMLSSSDRLPVPEKPWLVFSPTPSCC